MKIAVVALAGLLACGLSACNTIRGPGQSSVDAVVACGPSMGARKCVPDTGRDFRLNRESYTVPLDAQGRPQVLQWLGTVRRRNDLTGAAGAICGGGQPVFTMNDIVGLSDTAPASFARNYRGKKVVEFNVSGTLKADLMAALAGLNIPQPILDRVDANLDATVRRARNATFEVTGDFMQIQLDRNILSRLDVANPPAPYAECVAEIRSGRWSMYEAMTGWRVSEAKMSSTTVDNITASLAVSVAAAAPNVPLADIRTALNATVTNAITTTDRPRFNIIGLSFWEPVRYPPPAAPR